VTRVSDRDPVVLRFLTARGIALGDVLEIKKIRSGGAVTVQAPSGTHLLGSAVTAAIRAETSL